MYGSFLYQQPRLLCLTLVLTGIVAHVKSYAADDVVLKYVHEELYRDREAAIRLLEDRLQEEPKQLEYWLALIHALDVNGDSQFAERAAGMALKHFPGHPALFVARAQVLPAPAAWDQLDDLEQLPGHRDRARWLKDLLGVHSLDSYGDGRPTPRRALLQAGWARKFLTYGPFDRVPKTVRDGLEFDSNEKRLISLLPFVLALEKRFDEALAEHARQQYPQEREGSFVCLADCLLFLGQPRAAIASFHSEIPDDPAQRRVLAVAHAAIGEYDRAEELLADRAADALLKLRWDLNRGREQQVREQVPDILTRYCSHGLGSWAAPTYAAATGSAGREYRAAINWLYEEFPLKEMEIYQAFGSRNPTRAGFDRWKPDERIQQSARLFVAWLEKAIPDATGREQMEMRRSLSQLLASQQQYAAAADVLAPNAVIPVEEGLRENGFIRQEAVEWAILRRRVETRKLDESDPWALVKVRRLCNDIRMRNSSRQRDGEPVDHAETVAELLKLPSGILAPVMDAREPIVITAAGRTAFVAVMRTRGSLEDTPVLISTLRRTVRDELNSGNLSSWQLENDRRTADALHECLEHLTQVDGPDGSTRERSLFWADWWREHSHAVVYGEMDRGSAR